MKRALFLLALALPVAAQNSGPSANGDFQFTAAGLAKSIQFNARIHNNGSTSGQLVFVGAEDTPDQDVDGTGDASPAGLLANLSMTVDLDCLKIVGNRAVMSGKIVDASANALIGRRAIFAVEDGGEGAKASPDRYTWGLYRGVESGWVASDAELETDPGIGLTWLASDFEREDDIPVPSHPQSNEVGCNSFPLSSYAFEDVAKGAGNIQVKP